MSTQHPSSPLSDAQEATINGFERNAAGLIAAHYADTVILVDGTLGTVGQMVIPPFRAKEIAAHLSPIGEQVSTDKDAALPVGYVFVLNADLVPIQYEPCFA